MKIAVGVSVLSLSILTGALVASREPVRTTDLASVSKPISAISSTISFAKTWTGRPVYQSGPNCFGTTLAGLRVISKPRFANDLEIREFLKTCEPVKVAEPGDVGVIYDLSTKPISEVHSFIVLDPVRSFYKNGLEASGKFVTQKNSVLFHDFRVGASQAQCDRFAEESVEETGLPCPTSVRYFRCSARAVEIAVAAFSFPEKAAWTTLQSFDTKIASAALLNDGPRFGETQEMLTLLSNLNSALEGLDAPAADSQFATLGYHRIESFISFFLFSTDDSKWSRAEAKELVKGLTRARNRLLTLGAKIH